MSNNKKKKNKFLDPVKDANLIADMEAWEEDDRWESDLCDIDDVQYDLKAYAHQASEAIEKEEFREAFAAAQNALEEAEKLMNLLGRNGYGDAPASAFMEEDDEEDEEDDEEEDEEEDEDDDSDDSDESADDDGTHTYKVKLDRTGGYDFDGLPDFAIDASSDEEAFSKIVKKLQDNYFVGGCVVSTILDVLKGRKSVMDELYNWYTAERLAGRIVEKR